MFIKQEVFKVLYMKSVKGGRAMKSFLALLFVISLVHTFFIAFGGIPSYQGGISGQIVFDDIVNQYYQTPNSTKIILAAEWVLVLLIILYLLIKGKMRLDQDMQIIKEIKNPKEIKTYHKSRSETDIDVLYNILKERKVLRLSAIQKMFGVDKKTAQDWCKILEDGNLATIYYPLVGDLRIALVREEKEENEETKKK